MVNTNRMKINNVTGMKLIQSTIAHSHKLSASGTHTNCNPCGKHFDAVDMLMTLIINITWYLRTKRDELCFLISLEMNALFGEVASFSTFIKYDHVFEISAQILCVEIFDFTCLLQSRLNFRSKYATRNKCAFRWECALRMAHTFFTHFFPSSSHRSILFPAHSESDFVCR